MRKRRRLADKLTIMVCAVLVAVSAFFYAPMEVEASSYLESNDYTLSSSCNSYLNSSFSYFRSGDVPITFDFVDDLDSNTDYLIKYSGSLSLFLSSVSGASLKPNFSQIDLILKCTGKSVGLITQHYATSSNPYERNFSGSFFYDHNSSGKFSYNLACVMPFTGVSDVYIDSNFELNIVEVIPLSGSDSQSYQQGYNAGYSAGEQVGESNGYSNGYSDGYEAGEQDGYDSGFESGKESVDTQSYYDMGYSAGYDVGYLTGYETGYDEGYLDGFESGVSEGEITGYEKGYADALEYYTKGRVSNVPDFTWTGRYYFSGGNSIFDGSVIIPTNYTFLKEKEYNISFDIDWTSRIVSLNNISGTPSFSASGWEFDLCGVDFDMSSGIGHFSYDFIPATTSNNINMSFSVSSLFFPSDWTTAYSYSRDFSISVKNIVITSKTGRTSAEILEDMERQDLNTQNTIRDGFSDSMNGFDNSQGNAVNDDLSSGLNEYQTAEDSLWATATTGLKDFTFFDFESVPAMITGMSFITSIMGSWFSHVGGASGVGIVLSILFSVMLVAMVLGLYRLYQSKGGKK